MPEVTTVEDIVEGLRAVQIGAGLGDTEFAERVLGISQVGWWRIWNGQRKGNAEFILRALAVLADPASFLPCDEPNVSNVRQSA